MNYIIPKSIFGNQAIEIMELHNIGKYSSLIRDSHGDSASVGRDIVFKNQYFLDE